MERYQAERAADDATAAAEDQAVAAWLETAAEGREDQKPVRVLGKTLRDGRRFAPYLVPDTAPAQAQMLVLIAGKVVTEPFSAAAQRFTSPVPLLPHTLAVPLTRPGRRRAGRW
ncbi:hypothetical protein ABZ599_15715 [Streptomyces misionensis]|uniref:hypothetical protein n=1 Tax=Streptomyces misionensis TaxID=67331 RepID=UPI0033FC8852